ncbi:hypothetical protein EDC96DRAFT_514138 [Choanephora cucurbitarum]|nr:hypothetical protein EDC96DRAFT_514138 [Choanephora cucurbitarum]
MSERQSKTVQERHERILNEIVKRPENEFCADCGARNPRWASYSLGIFLCIRCAGIHRKMGTHISKVKSITMDQWTMEQIEMMRNSGGNTTVNQKVNPNPANHPLPITHEDDHAIEKYIRAKWEKRAFVTNNVSPPPSSPMPLQTQVQPQPQSQVQSTLQKASPAVARLQVLPKRSSSVPVVNNINDNMAGLQYKLLQLHEMGFRDEHKNRQILSQTQGSFEATVEILSRLAQQPQIQQKQPQHSIHMMTDEQKLEHLMKLGFSDRQQNIDALRRAGGNIEIAITIVNEAKSAQPFASQNASQQHLSNRSISMPALHSSTSNNNSPLLVDAANTNAHNPFASSQPLSAFSAQPLQQQPQQIAFPVQPQQVAFTAPLQAQNTAFAMPPLQQQQPDQLQTNPSSPFQQPFQSQQQPFQQNAFSQSSPQMLNNPFNLLTPKAPSAFPVINNTMNSFPTQSPLPLLSAPQTTSNPFTQMAASSYLNTAMQSQQPPLNPWSTTATTGNSLF